MTWWVHSLIGTIAWLTYSPVAVDDDANLQRWSWAEISAGWWAVEGVGGGVAVDGRSALVLRRTVKMTGAGGRGWLTKLSAR